MNVAEPTARAQLGRAIGAIVAAACVVALLPAAAAGEQASQPESPAAGRLDVSAGTDLDPSGHTCVVAGGVRCWGFGGAGRLGYANALTIGDDEHPGSAGAVHVGAGRSATAISAGGFHTCAVLDDGALRCWGFGADGRLGYASVATIGDDEHPADAGPVLLGAGRSAAAVSAGGGHTCALLDDGAVRCWGFGSDGRLGYGNRATIGDDEHPSAAGPVPLGAGRTARAVSAGRDHSCAVLDDGGVRCWGYGFLGRLGYGNTTTIGDDETPQTVGPVNLGAGRTVRAISAGDGHTCALLDDGAVRCWGYGGNGRLGYGGVQDIGDNETPESVGPVDLGRRARAISAGDAHSCALLDDGGVRCWGFGADGRLGYGNENDVGDDETPAAAGPVDLGPGRTALAISAGGRHTCALLDDGGVRCWGYGFTGRLGLCNELNVGDDERPGSVGPVNLSPSAPGCRVDPPGPPTGRLPPPCPCPVAPGSGEVFTSKLELARATIVRRLRMLDVLAPISSLASGPVQVQLHAVGIRHRFSVAVDAQDARIRFRRTIPAAQARLGMGILTLAYPGDADTAPQTVRLRAAARPARLRMTRPRIVGGRVRAAGTISRLARGVVRVQVQYAVGRQSTTLALRAPIRNGRWSLDERLSQAAQDAIARRSGTVHSYTLFTGYAPRRMRGEMRSFQVLPAR